MAFDDLDDFDIELEAPLSAKEKKRIKCREGNKVDVQQLRKLARYHCTIKEIADFFGVNEKSVTNDPMYIDIINSEKATTSAKLRKKLLDSALAEKPDSKLLMMALVNFSGMVSHRSFNQQNLKVGDKSLDETNQEDFFRGYDIRVIPKNEAANTAS